jgi:hypothetical protein
MFTKLGKTSSYLSDGVSVRWSAQDSLSPSEVFVINFVLGSFQILCQDNSGVVKV